MVNIISMASAFLKLNRVDFYKGLIVAVLTAILPVLNEAIQNGADIFAYDWSFVLKLSVSAGIGYLLKNLFSVDGKFAGRV